MLSIFVDYWNIEFIFSYLFVLSDGSRARAKAIMWNLKEFSKKIYGSKIKLQTYILQWTHKVGKTLICYFIILHEKWHILIENNETKMNKITHSAGAAKKILTFLLWPISLKISEEIRILYTISNIKTWIVLNFE